MAIMTECYNNFSKIDLSWYKIKKSDQYIFCLVWQETYILIKETGWEMPTIESIVFTENEVGWTSVEDTPGKGDIRLNIKHENWLGSIAHEIAHGVHEILREDKKYSHKIVENEGEEFCQLFRFEVQRRYKAKYENDCCKWNYNNYHPGFIYRFNNWNNFIKWLNG